MRVMKTFLLLMAVFCIIAGPSSAGSAKDAIAAANAEFVTAYNAKNAAGVAALYAEDGAILPPNFVRVDGRANIQAYWQGGMNMGLTALTLTTTEAQEAGDWAYETGAYTAKYPDKSGAMADEIGKYTVVWKKSADGKWQLFRDIWNTDPATTP